jgi:predicted nucleic acid-binding protein
MTILADSSSWVDHLRQLDTALGRELSIGRSVAYSEPILMEILMGARTEEEWRQLRRFMAGADLLPFDSVADFEGAARINREGRANGITLGKFDCLILSVARRTGAALLTRDRRQGEVGRLVGVDVLT